MWLQVRFPDCFAVVHAAELIKDTQDYLDIHLDSTQNRLIRLDLITASATFSVALYTLFAGNAFAAVGFAKKFAWNILHLSLDCCLELYKLLCCL